LMKIGATLLQVLWRPLFRLFVNVVWRWS